jgi:hypothetical protein
VSDKVARSFSLVNVWETVPPTAIYTHYTLHGAAHLDQIYVTSNLHGQKVGEGGGAVFVAFTDHPAVYL